MNAPDERFESKWLDAFQRALAHVPVTLYDEDRKPAERALDEMLTELRRKGDAIHDALALLDEVPYEDGEAQDAIQAVRAALKGEAAHDTSSGPGYQVPGSRPGLEGQHPTGSGPDSLPGEAGGTLADGLDEPERKPAGCFLDCLSYPHCHCGHLDAVQVRPEQEQAG